MNLRLIDPQGKEVASQQGEPSNNRYPTTLWSAGEIVRDNRALMIAGALPNGAYRLQMRLDGDAQWTELTEVSKQ